MKRTRYILAALLALIVTTAASAQSKSFSLGKWVELHNAILKELNRSYVDSLEVGRIEREGVDAMLEALDPYISQELETLSFIHGEILLNC